MIASALVGVRVLIVEDEPLIAFDLEQTCLDFGAAATHIARTASELEHIDLSQFDIAVLDHHLGADTSHGIARRLKQLARPFVFSSGFDDESARAEFPTARFLSKPYSTNQLIEAMRSALAASPSGV